MCCCCTLKGAIGGSLFGELKIKSLWSILRPCIYSLQCITSLMSGHNPNDFAIFPDHVLSCDGYWVSPAPGPNKSPAPGYMHWGKLLLFAHANHSRGSTQIKSGLSNKRQGMVTPTLTSEEWPDQ